MSIRCMLLILMLVQVGATQATEAGQVIEGPWDQSVQLEREGALRGAEATVVSAWGSEPDNFYAQLRLAYLALLARRGPEGVADLNSPSVLSIAPTSRMGGSLTVFWDIS